MTYGRFVSTPNLFGYHAKKCISRDSILDVCCTWVIVFAQNLWSSSICCNIHCTFSINVRFFFNYTILFYCVWSGCLFHNAILLVKCIEITKVIFVTSITFNYFDLLSSLIFYQSFENLKFVKHTKFSLHGIKKRFIREIINKSKKKFLFHVMLLP